VPAEAGGIAHNHTMVTAPAKREIAEDPTKVRMTYLPILEPRIEDPADPGPNKTSFVANCNDLFMVNDSLLMVNNKTAESCCHLLRI
jgi:hypothetical protein